MRLVLVRNRVDTVSPVYTHRENALMHAGPAALDQNEQYDNKQHCCDYPDERHVSHVFYLLRLSG